MTDGYDDGIYDNGKGENRPLWFIGVVTCNLQPYTPSLYLKKRLSTG